MKQALNIGPLLYNWQPDFYRDYYFKIADEVDVDTIYLGEVVCAKRMPLFYKELEQVISRLKKAGKEIVYSTLALVNSEIERKRIVAKCFDFGFDFVEVNDLSLLNSFETQKTILGPYINVYNIGAIKYFENKGINNFNVPFELSFEALNSIKLKTKASFEIQIFGQIPLAISSRCYHARSYGLSKDNCNFICQKDKEGLIVKTVDDKDFLLVNGLQTMSSTCVNLINEIKDLQKIGINNFRIAAMDCKIKEITQVFRAAIDGEIEKEEARAKLCKLVPEYKFSNGFFHGIEGHKYHESLMV